MFKPHVDPFGPSESVAWRSCKCICTVVSRSVIDDAASDHEQQPDAVTVLRSAVRTARQDVLRNPTDLVNVDRSLVAFRANVAPIYDQLEAAACAQPAGAVAVVLDHMQAASRHATLQQPETAVSSVITAAIMAFRLVDEATLDVEELHTYRDV